MTVALSPRQLEIVRLYASGQSRTEIADQLAMSERTVDSHRRAAIDKLFGPAEPYTRQVTPIAMVRRALELGRIEWSCPVIADE